MLCGKPMCSVGGLPTYSSISLFMELIPHARRGLGVHTSSFICMKSLQCYTVLILGRGVATLGMSPASRVKSVPSFLWGPVFYTDLVSLRKVKVMSSV